ncbi:MAG TPA: short-chain dehydrogenase [Rhodospirillaceae bacterium]|nr:short-chain dehydrogenase [Rhodospirillaceae bacterium]HAA92931.1 short-chain dehydrogenase [Rhodospirillaceae bacterium]HAT36667.1 short-chain dehydrogenase [Rhodospirillaceae bacterium]
MPTVMVTGASRGIGREFVSQYREAGWNVVATCRDPEGAGYGEGEAYELDVADPVSVKNLAEQLDGEVIDLLINNAGINLAKHTNFGNLDYDAWDEVLWVNVLAPLRVSEIFAPHVERSKRKQIIFLSSIMGSIAENSGGMPIYRSSKAALNQAVRSVAPDLRAKGITTLLIHPGWVQTDMGGPSAAIDAQTSVTAMRETFEALTPSMAGQYVNYDGTPIPW